MSKSSKSIDSIFAVITAKCGERDHYGNWKIKGSRKTYRIKPQSVSLRFEVLLNSGVWRSINPNKDYTPVYYKNSTSESIGTLVDKLIATAD